MTNQTAFLSNNLFLCQPSDNTIVSKRAVWLCNCTFNEVVLPGRNMEHNFENAAWRLNVRLHLEVLFHFLNLSGCCVLSMNSADGTACTTDR
jgi:hypothetical protein